MQDGEIIRKARQHHPEALKPLVDKYYAPLYRFAYLRVQDQDLALDLVQETFYRFIKNLDHFQEEKSVLPYLFQILKNLHHNFKYRYAHRMRTIEDFLLISRDKPPDEEAMENDLKEKLMRALKKIPEDDQTLLILKEFEDYSYKELADFFDVPVGTIMSRLFYARKKLKEAFLEVTHEIV